MAGAALAFGWLVAMMMAAPLAMAAPEAMAAAPVLTVGRAEFSALPSLDAALPQPGAGTPVSLPHRWGQGPGIGAVAGRYRIEFDAAPGDAMQALRFELVSERARLWLNGALLAEVGSERREQHIYRSMPLLVPLPPALLRAGRNELELRVEHGLSTRATLSPMEFGPLDELADRHARWRRWLMDIPQNANLLAMALAGLTILVWVRRRQETALGLFGMLYLSGSWRNYGYYSEIYLPAALWDGFQFATVIWGAALSLFFAAHYTAPHRNAVPWPRLRRVVLVWAAALTLCAVVAVALGKGEVLTTLRRLSYPLLPALNLLTVWLFVGHAIRSRGWPESLMAGTFALLVASGIHDNLMIFGVISGLGVFSLPYTMPVLMAVFSVVLLNRVLEAMHVAEDLTHALELRVAERTRDLAAANEAKSRFLAAASHDLRQPLNAIALLVGLLRERIRYPEVRALVDKAQATVEGMSGLLRGLLDLSRLEGGQVRPRIEPVALQPLLAAVLATDLPQAQARGIALRVARCQAVVLTDRTLLDSMLRNLVANAIRYTPSGGVLVGVRRRGGKAWLQVIDSGLGIAEGERQQVFDEFYRGQAAKGSDAGFGLGLSIVQRAARLLGHPLELQSQAGRGTCVQIGLPLAPPGAATARQPGNAPGAAEPDRLRIAGSFIALIEDQETERDAVAQLLRHWGCHVVQGAHLEELSAALQQHLRQPDILISDYRLGGGRNGLDALCALRSALDRPELPALLLTAETQPEVMERARGLGIPVLHKPASAADLCSRLAAMLPA